MRFFARAFIICALVIYIIVIGVQLFPKEGADAPLETLFKTGRGAVSSLKHFLFQDEELITVTVPGDVEVPLPITVNLNPVKDRFQDTPPKTGSSGSEQSTWIDRIVSYVPFAGNNSSSQNTAPSTQTPVQNTTAQNTTPRSTPLSVSCSASAYTNDITWAGTATGGAGGYSYSWNSGSYGGSNQYRVSYTTAGAKTISLSVRDQAGTNVSTSCSFTLITGVLDSTTSTATTTPTQPPSTTSPVTSCNLDWCAPTVVRPDYKWDNLATCVPTWSTDEIAQYAKMAWYGQSGNELPNTLGISYESTTCWGQLSLSKQKTYNDEVKAKATALGRRVYIANAFRFDIVTHSVMAQPGFNAAWLVRPATPHQAYVDFYANDTSPVCGGTAKTCRLTYSRGVNQEGRDTGRRLRDMIDASGGAGAYQNVVYYVARPGDGDTVGWAIAALADQRIAAYRTWRVNQARQILRDGNFDFVMLNHKFHFFKAENNWTTPPQSWLGGAWAPNVTALQSSDDTPFSNPPLNYGYPEYVEGWNALARDLRAAGVPYMVQTNGGPWVNPSNFNDPATPSIDEAALIREGIEGAGLIELDYQSWLSSSARAQLDQKVQELEARGIVVIKIRSECGYGNGTPTSCTTANNTIAPTTQLASVSFSNSQLAMLILRLTAFIAVVWILILRKKQKRFS